MIDTVSDEENQNFKKIIKIVSNVVQKKMQEIKSIIFNPSKKIQYKKLSDIKYQPNNEVVNLIVLLLDLRNLIVEVSK